MIWVRRLARARATTFRRKAQLGHHPLDPLAGLLGVTRLELLTTKDTVAIDTPAASATSRMVVAIARLRSPCLWNWDNLLTNLTLASQTRAQGQFKRLTTKFGSLCKAS
jgi:hypothetical protein